jgi:hypothetical protein
MASYQPQPQHQQTGRRADEVSVDSVNSSWIVTELARATHENIFSDTVSTPLSTSRQSASAESELWEEQVSSDMITCLTSASRSPHFNDPIPHT